MKNTCIATILLCVLSAQAARSQTYYMLDSVSVTASKLPVPVHKNTRTVTLMDSLAIASAPAESINDLLKYALGVDVRQRGAMGMQTDISMRGGTYNQIAVLLNGIDISDPQTGHNSADFPVSPADIDHIEVLEGPAARGHGASSMVGAINIVTKEDGRGATLNLEGGSFQFGNVNASAALRGRHTRHTVSTGWQRSDGFNRNAAGGLNNDFNAFKAFYRGSAGLLAGRNEPEKLRLKHLLQCPFRRPVRAYLQDLRRRQGRRPGAPALHPVPLLEPR